jgi:GDPmannose 4,6-dehydratase
MSKIRAIITGISGQDGSYLAELLLEKGYEVWGVLRRHSLPENQSSRLNEAGIFNHPLLHLVYGDVTDLPSLCHLFQESQPHEIYNLAAQSHVRISFDQPAFTTMADANGVLNVLEAARLHCPLARIYQAGSSEMFGNECDEDGYRRETTLMRPVSPYGCAKLYAYNLCRVYRSSYDMFISNGILFNHESPRRGLNFVTNKVVDAAIKISKGEQNLLALGNMNSTRDWGHAKDYVRAMWMMLQYDKPDDFVCATGESRSIKELCAEVFSELDLDYRDYITIDSKYFRPTELINLRGDATKLRETLGWEPTYSFRDMIEEMVKARL